MKTILIDIKSSDMDNTGFNQCDFFTCEFRYDSSQLSENDNPESEDITPDKVLVYIKFYNEVTESSFNTISVDRENVVLFYRKQFSNKINTKSESYKKELAFYKKEINGLRKNEGNGSLDLKRILSRENKLKELNQNKLKNVNLSEWSFLKTNKEEMFIEEPISNETKTELLKYYAIKPDLVSLNTKSEKLNIRDNLLNKIQEKKNNLIGFKELIEISDNKNYKYEYRIVIYQTGISLLDNKIKDFYGIDYNNLYDELPYLNLGEIYSDRMILGENVVNVIVDEPKPEPKKLPVKKSKIPVMKFFEPKEGNSNTIIRIVGSGLEDLEYICFRDIKVKVLKKNKRRIKEGKYYVLYDEFLVKPPTLKELNKECWQSLERYKVLVWGYYPKEGLQIRTNENSIDKLMFKYNERTECPKKERLSIPE